MNTRTAALDAVKSFEEYERKLRFARACELAQSRRYLEAEAILAPGGRWPARPDELDLLGRMCACQRLYGRACEYWDAALKIDPAEPSYERAIQKARAAQKQWRFVFMVINIALAVATAAATGIVVDHVLKWGGVKSDVDRSLESPPSKSSATPAMPEPPAIPSGFPPAPETAPPAQASTPQKQ